MPSMDQLDRQAVGKSRERRHIQCGSIRNRNKEGVWETSSWEEGKHPPPRGHQASFSHCLLPTWESRGNSDFSRGPLSLRVGLQRLLWVP